MDKWEIIARKMAILAAWGYDLQHFPEYLDNPPVDFLTDEWVKQYYGYFGKMDDQPLFDDLNAIDLLASNSGT